MSIVANVLVGLVALLHVYFLVLEMFLWDKPAGLKAFGQTLEAARASKVLAANQGLYNGFLAAGLVWSLVGPEHLRFGFAVFFLLCVVVAGLYGICTRCHGEIPLQRLELRPWAAMCTRCSSQ